jgi:hypothetical protein
MPTQGCTTSCGCPCSHRLHPVDYAAQVSELMKMLTPDLGRLVKAL